MLLGVFFIALTLTLIFTFSQRYHLFCSLLKAQHFTEADLDSGSLEQKTSSLDLNKLITFLSIHQKKGLKKDKMFFFF